MVRSEILRETALDRKIRTMESVANTGLETPRAEFVVIAKNVVSFRELCLVFRTRSSFSENRVQKCLD